MKSLQISGLSASYGGQQVLRDLNLDISAGSFVSLLGPSGCGKTTTLRLVAGLMEASAGRIDLEGRDLLRVPSHRRNIGLVFQNYALLPHLNVVENVAYGLRQRGMGTAERLRKAAEFLDLVGLQGFAERTPDALSGGQKQRVSLARALVIDPDLMMFDEPLSNLDARLRLGMRSLIRRLHLQRQTTSIYVTHDQEEAFAISDRVAVMNSGKVEQYDRPEVLYARPASRFVANFVGFENIFPYRLISRAEGLLTISTLGGTLTLPDDPTWEVLPTGLLAARPEALSFGDSSIALDVTLRTYLGRGYAFEATAHGTPILLHSDSADAPATPRLSIDPRQITFLPPDQLSV
ncbi:ABC transporter ATP-binding protein [Ketogulonicigenium vulgare]|uniref:ABC transporter ATP-binding protein n=1 Tax=Ketogulonicigenium vulgare TaxID=92945 RepID=UPI002358B222|nr:ABC transporter ATP-binding protein [Ketogulonicigenium vulgare]